MTAPQPERAAWPAAAQRKAVLYLDLIRWNRPAGWLLLLWPSLSALWLAAGGWPGWHLLAVFVLGTMLMRSAGCCINDVADREFDRHVKRTAQRPVTAGKLSVREALAVGAALALAAFGLALTLNVVAVLWSFAALAVALIYPYAKRWFAMPQAVLGVAFSFGIPMAFAAVHGRAVGAQVTAAQWLQADFWQAVWHSVPPLAWLLLLGNLFWVLAYDTEYAMVDRDDDLRIGIQTSAITLGRWDVVAIMGFYVAYLLIWSAALWGRVHSGVWLVAVLAAAAQVLWHYKLIHQRQREDCFRAFRLNHWLGCTLFVGVALGL